MAAAELSASPLRIGVTRTGISGDEIAHREHFARCQSIFCQSALEPALLANLQRLCDTGGFKSDSTEPGHREIESPQRAGRALNLVLSRPEMLGWLERTTSCGPLTAIEGSVAQIFPRTGDELRWHDDRIAGEDRRLALVILLGAAAYQGGEFELRHKAGDLLVRHKHTEPGSLLIFAVHRDLEHRVLPLTAGGPRRVFAGWAMGKATS